VHLVTTPAPQNKILPKKFLRIIIIKFCYFAELI